VKIGLVILSDEEKKKQGKKPAIQIYWSHSRGQTSEIHSALLLLATRFNSFLFNV